MRLAVGVETMKESSKIAAAGPCRGILRNRAGSRTIFGCAGFVAAIRSATCFYPGLVFSRALLSSSPPASPPLPPPLLPWQLCLLAHTTETRRDMWSPRGFTMEKSGSGIHVALQSSGRKTITHGLTNTHTHTHTSTQSNTHTHTHTLEDELLATFQSLLLHTDSADWHTLIITDD